MKKDIVVTNLRIHKVDWLQIKAAAAELDMSANEYTNFLIKSAFLKRELSERPIPYQDLPIWKLDKIVSSKKGKGLSPEDKIIYK